MIAPQAGLRLLTLLFALLAAPSYAADPNREWVLALSWEPAFCESVNHRPAECRTAGTGDHASTNLVLHGLWPENGAYCGVGGGQIALDKARDWDRLPPLPLSPATREELNRRMPGTQSFLHRHEWIKHGSCSGLTAEEYFSLSLRLTREAEGLKTRELIARSLGHSITYEELCESLRADFGKRGPDAVKVRQKKLRGKYYLTELQFRLSTGTDGRLSLHDDLVSGKAVGCDSRSLFIDPPGQSGQ